MDVRTVVVGSRYHTGADERLRGLRPGDQLLLLREPLNPFDKHAVAVTTLDGVKLGYVPRQDAPLVAKAIDLGLEPSVTCVQHRGPAIRVTWEN